VFSIEDRILDDQWTSVPDAVVRMLGQIRGVFRRVCVRGRESWDDLKAPALQSHFWLRNEPYASTDPRNHLKSQQMRPPSERTKRVTNRNMRHLLLEVALLALPEAWVARVIRAAREAGAEGVVIDGQGQIRVVLSPNASAASTSSSEETDDGPASTTSVPASNVGRLRALRSCRQEGGCVSEKMSTILLVMPLGHQPSSRSRAVDELCSRHSG
jgi:hypothetical protein